MYCPFCHSDQVIVSNSRPSHKNIQIWRRRKCLKCGGVFTTREKMTASFLVVEKHDGRHVQYAHSKLFASVYRSIIGRKRIDQGEASKIAENITQKIEEKLITGKNRVVKTSDLIVLVIKTLAKPYPGSALRYFAYFSRSVTIEDQIKQLKKILKNNTNF